MQNIITLNYFYGSEAEQFSFYRVPKLLFTDDYFSNISTDSKILYSILLDRMSLSIKNRWVDKDNRVYIIYTIEEVKETMNCGERKAIYLMSELDTKKGIGLIEKKQQGLGKPNLIYVKNFRIDKDYSDYAQMEVNETTQINNINEEFKNSKNMQVKNSINVQIKNCKNVQVKNRKNEQIKNCNNMQIKNCENGGTNNTNNNSTDNINTNPIYQSNDRMEFNTIDGINLYEHNLKEIKQKIGYADLILKLDCNDIQQLDEIVDIMAEFVSFKRDKVMIKGVEYPYEFVKMKIMKNDYSSIEYLLDSFNNSTSKKPNIEGYVISMLFNAPSTINNYYKSAVNHDMAYFDWKKGIYSE